MNVFSLNVYMIYMRTQAVRAKRLWLLRLCKTSVVTAICKQQRLKRHHFCGACCS